MKRKAGTQQRLRRLAVITAATLAGIIALQVYWLYTSYTQQRKRFKADITSTLADVSMYESMDNVMKTGAGGNGVVSSFVINFTNTKGAKPAKKPYSITVSDDDQSESKASPGVFVAKGAKGTVSVTQGLIDSLMDSSRVKMTEELQKREIHVPFEMAIINDKGAIVKATCDTNRFHKIPLKPAPRPLVTDGAKAQLMLQTAFPDANLYLLRRMAMILSVTSLLIIIGAWSFSYMLIHFFRQKKMADIRNDFMNNMTHELKTPISGALVAMELAEGKKHLPDEATRLEYIGVAKSEMLRLATLLDQVLKMAAFDQNEIPISKSPQPVYDLVCEAVKNLHTLTDNAGAEITINAVSKTLVVYADKMHLVHAMQNLLENAIKYNDKPKPLISFNISGDVNGITISVADNGKGIPQAYIARVFDKFFRVPSGDIHDIKGYGLGLSYVKAIITLHGGTIAVSSKEKEGSVFTLFIPFN